MLLVGIPMAFLSFAPHALRGYAEVSIEVVWNLQSLKTLSVILSSINKIPLFLLNSKQLEFL